ncbi:MAG: M15 family metallopeptidase [Cyanobacteria bacterium P01_C01_bin.121]
MKPYQKVPIEECGEALLPIPLDQFSVVSPHPYEALGAPYGNRSPYFLREGVLCKLLEAQSALQQQCPGWQLQIFDAYRPIPVQQFMVDYTFAQLAKKEGIAVETISDEVRSRLHAEVIKFWAVPSANPSTPPPHSTGAAIDLTLVDDKGDPVDMGSAIDEISPRSYPNHFENSPEPAAQKAHDHRSLLARVMVSVGFCQHPNEWWHFSLGDQLWAWQMGEGAISPGQGTAIARYGGA